MKKNSKTKNFNLIQFQLTFSHFCLASNVPCFDWFLFNVAFQSITTRAFPLLSASASAFPLETAPIPYNSPPNRVSTRPLPFRSVLIRVVALWSVSTSSHWNWLQLFIILDQFHPPWIQTRSSSIEEYGINKYARNNCSILALLTSSND